MQKTDSKGFDVQSDMLDTMQNVMERCKMKRGTRTASLFI